MEGFRVRQRGRENKARESDKTPPLKTALESYHHVVLSPVCRRTTKEESMAIDCRVIDNQT